MSKRARDAKRLRRYRRKSGTIPMEFQGQQFVDGVGLVDVWKLEPVDADGKVWKAVAPRLQPIFLREVEFSITDAKPENG